MNLIPSWHIEDALNDCIESVVPESRGLHLHSLQKILHEPDLSVYSSCSKLSPDGMRSGTKQKMARGDPRGAGVGALGRGAAWLNRVSLQHCNGLTMPVPPFQSKVAHDQGWCHSSVFCMYCIVSIAGSKMTENQRKECVIL